MSTIALRLSKKDRLKIDKAIKTWNKNNIGLPQMTISSYVRLAIIRLSMEGSNAVSNNK